MTLQLGIILAALCAVATNAAFLLKHRGAVAAPAVEWRHPLRSAVGLFRSWWFAIGMLVAVGAWTLHVAALALAPLSLVQAVLAGGLVFLTVIAERFFGLALGLRQWLGVGFTALGLVLLAVTLPAAGDPGYSLAAMISFRPGCWRSESSWCCLRDWERARITGSCSVPPPGCSSGSRTSRSRR